MNYICTHSFDVQALLSLSIHGGSTVKQSRIFRRRVWETTLDDMRGPAIVSCHDTDSSVSVEDDQTDKATTTLSSVSKEDVRTAKDATAEAEDGSYTAAVSDLREREKTH